MHEQIGMSISIAANCAIVAHWAIMIIPWWRLVPETVKAETEAEAAAALRAKAAGAEGDHVPWRRLVP